MSSRPHIVRSVSLDTDLALWVEEQAAGENRSVSNFVNTLLGRLRDRAAGLPPGIRISRIVPTAPAAATTPVRKPAATTATVAPATAAIPVRKPARAEEPSAGPRAVASSQ